MKDVIVFSKKEDSILKRIGGEISSFNYSIYTDRWSKYHETFVDGKWEDKNKNCFLFLGRIKAIPVKDGVIIINIFDKDVEDINVPRTEFISDPETWIELMDTEVSKNEFEKRENERTKNFTELDFLGERLMKALYKKGGFEFENYGKSKVKIKEVFKQFGGEWVLSIESSSPNASSSHNYTEKIQIEEVKTGYRDFKTNTILYEAILAE